MTGCILTPYALNTNCYGHLKKDNKTVLHHRLVFATANNLALDDLQGLVIRHTCHNRKCVNPEHLVSGTSQDNANDTVQAGRWGGGRRQSLTTQQQEEIVAATRATQDELALKYGVARATIARVLAKHNLTTSKK